MKVLIINPPSVDGIKFVREGRCEQRLSSFQYVMVPISLPSIAGVLRGKGYNVKIIDCIAENLSIDDIVRVVSEFAPSLIVVNFSTATFDGDSGLVDAISKGCKGHITAIGTHVTAVSEDSLKTTQLSSVVRGEPEATCLDLADCIKEGRSLSSVKGISYKTDGNILHNEARKFIEDLDALPFPARDLLDNRKYTLPVINKPYTLLISSRGCPYNCIFCTAKTYYGKKLRLRSSDSVLKEIEEVISRDKVNYITMWSDTFTLNRDFVVKICEGIIAKGLKVSWMCNSRVDKVDKEILLLMKKSGCIGISYGVESGVQEILNNVEKGINIQQIKDAFRRTREAGIETLAHIIFGLPGETKETIEKTIRFVIDLDPDYAQFYCAIPFPGTEFYEMAKEKNWIVADSWDRYELNQTIISTDQLSSDELKNAKVIAYRRFYLRPAYVLKRLKKIKSYRDLSMTVRQSVNFIKEWVLKG
ncbi:MAG: B12-binding domain-containing radical SAM protein [Thermodesulfobacteriota bacterium]